MYFMGNSVLIRCETEMTHLEPHLVDTRYQELRSSPFCPTPLFCSQLVKEREELLLNKATPKTTLGLRSYQNQPFCGPHHNKKEGSYRGQSTPSSNQSFSSGRGKSSRSFPTSPKGTRMWKPLLPMTP